LPGTGCRGHNELAGGLDFCNFARRTDIDDEPTPEPGVYDAFLLLSWVFPINVKRTRLSIRKYDYYIIL